MAMTLDEARDAGVAYRAPVGGCYAANGEFYAGGQWVNIEKVDAKSTAPCKSRARGPVGEGEVENYFLDSGRLEIWDMRDRDHILRDMVARVASTGNPLSEKAFAFANSIIARIKQRDAEAMLPRESCPTGRVVITGEVISVYTRDTQWGVSAKCIVRDDRGFKVCGMAVGAAGSRITFSAGVSRSDGDEFFGFFKRPTKITCL